MASIEYGIDKYGRKVYAQEAFHGCTYTCPYCFEEIYVRKCSKKEDYFAHKPISNRTPQQRICPGYTGQDDYKRIEGNVDKVFVTNGGLPLYLCAFDSGKYQLNAYFSPLSESSMKKLEEWNAKVVITEGRMKEEYSVSNIQFYRVKTITEWIDVKCKKVKDSIREVKQKWEWGIRGLDCARDIFHSHYDGGCRVALHSNIVLGKEYLIVKRNDILFSIEGISFVKKGVLAIKGLYDKSKYSVYAMTIDRLTDESIAYIQNKGYQLIEKSDEIIPMWPPAVIQGKELIYRRHMKNAFLFHCKQSDQGIFNMTEYGITNIKENENIFETETNNKTLLLSDHRFNSLSNEIRFMLTQNRNNFDNDRGYKPNIVCKINENTLSLEKIDRTEIFEGEKVFFEANGKIKMDICILKKNYVEMASKRIIENLKRKRVLVIDIGAFGKIWIKPKLNGAKENKVRKVYIDDMVEYLYYCCHSISVPISNEIFQVFDYARKNSEELYRVMLPWIIKQKIPFAAARYLHSIKGVLKNE